MRGRNEGAGEEFCSFVVTPRLRWGEEASLSAPPAFTSTLPLLLARGGDQRNRAVQSVGLRPLPCTDGMPPDGRGQPLVARVRLWNRQAWRKDSAYESGSQKAGSADWESHR